MPSNPSPAPFEPNTAARRPAAGALAASWAHAPMAPFARAFRLHHYQAG